jgi:hypothetical protein
MDAFWSDVSIQETQLCWCLKKISHNVSMQEFIFSPKEQVGMLDREGERGREGEMGGERERGREEERGRSDAAREPMEQDIPPSFFRSILVSALCLTLPIFPTASNPSL